MIVALRADASPRIGSGHLMRCLTLADALRAAGHRCQFLTRDPPPHLVDLVRARGHALGLLPAPGTHAPTAPADGPSHAHWLAVDWSDDAGACRAVLAGPRPDWLVVDHYALDARWEAVLAPQVGRVLAIDDLADRAHRADLLLDVNAGRRAEDYDRWLAPGTPRLIGPSFALLRPEFAAARPAALARREDAAPRHVLIAMGGVDLPDASSAALDGLCASRLPADARITVVMGAGAPALARVRERAAALPWPCEVAVEVDDMAGRMARADLAVGAAGGTAWERCCLGLPSIVVVLADNQRDGARALAEAGAAQLVESVADLAAQLPGCVDAWSAPGALARASQRAAALCDGLGTARVIEAMVR